MKFFNNKGFTLIELMVSVGIFSIMTALLLARADRFDSGIVLSNLAYDVALTIREAQAYGINVRETRSGYFDKAYGVEFRSSLPDQFVLYTDLDGDRRYDSNEAVKRHYLKRGATISRICYGDDENNCPSRTLLNTVFIRPNPTALITSNYNYAEITVRARDGQTKKVIVRKTGQISVE